MPRRTGNRLSRIVPLVLLVTLAVVPTLPAQVATASVAWRATAGQSIEWLRFLPAGLLLVSADDGLRAFDAASGQPRWARDDLRNVSQVAYEGTQQGGTLTGAGAAPAGAVIRTMEELPGGTAVALLADSAGSHSWFDVLDVATGATRWSSRSLPIGEAHGFLPFPDSTSLLVYGLLIEPGRSRRLWARVDAATGAVRWVSDSLLLQIPAQFDPAALAASTGTINGNQPLLPLADGTVLLAASGDGLVRFDAATGRVRWRSAQSRGEASPIGQGYAPMVLSGDTASLPAARAVDAVELTTGRRLWTNALAHHARSSSATNGSSSAACRACWRARTRGWPCRSRRWWILPPASPLEGRVERPHGHHAVPAGGRHGAPGHRPRYLHPPRRPVPLIAPLRATAALAARRPCWSRGTAGSC